MNNDTKLLNYLRARARNDWESALKHLDECIENETCELALETLRHMRRETLDRVPKKWNWNALLSAVRGERS